MLLMCAKLKNNWISLMFLSQEWSDHIYLTFFGWIRSSMSVYRHAGINRHAYNYIWLPPSLSSSEKRLPPLSFFRPNVMDQRLKHVNGWKSIYICMPIGLKRVNLPLLKSWIKAGEVKTVLRQLFGKPNKFYNTSNMRIEESCTALQKLKLSLFSQKVLLQWSVASFHVHFWCISQEDSGLLVGSRADQWIVIASHLIKSKFILMQ